ncbi:Alkane 1-monooxygenase protein [Dioscorea alata]|uniref:Alkane 1-monooxygenase protein n=1 Tax=Dioscorea alata TaxID=55571 RepID=A0ACB7W256_DIOAL|nr:Alkane 1-monooxygenase protein [Dioscorea alata]
MFDHLRISDIAAALTLFFASRAVIQRLTTKGPMLWPFLGIIPTLFTNITRTFTYHGISFSGYAGVMTCDPANIEYMLNKRFTNFPKGKYYRERFADFLGSGIFNADDQVWKEQRRAAAVGMHSSRFVEYSAQITTDLVHCKLLRLIEKVMENKGCVDLQDLLLRFTFDNICTAAFGVDPGCLAAGVPVIPFAKAFEEATELTLFQFIVPPFVLDVSWEKKLKIAVRTVYEFAEKVVSDRRASGVNERADLLSQLMQVYDVSNDLETCFSDVFLKDLCISFILAGRDTSSVALAWFFWLLHTHPTVEDHILIEINTIIKQRSIGPRDQTDVVFSIDELKKMQYLQAAVSESLRLYPSVPLEFKEAIDDDIFPDGTFVKKGARVIYSLYSMARMESIWGKDCKEFRPERWLRDGMLISENQFKYAPGPRLCIGKKFAYMQMKMVAANILLRYHVEVVPGQEVVPKMTTTLYMKNGLKVRFKPRDDIHVGEVTTISFPSILGNVVISCFFEHHATTSDPRLKIHPAVLLNNGGSF